MWLSGQSCAGQVVDGLDAILLGHVVEPVRGTLEAHGMASLDGQMVRAGIRKHPLISFRFSMSKQLSHISKEQGSVALASLPHSTKLWMQVGRET